MSQQVAVAKEDPICAPAAGSLPNVILIVADDLGYGDVGCFGSSDLRTSHLDALAARGMRFTDAYVGNPVCGPSRACLLTGRYATRYGFEINWDNILPPVQPSVAEMMRQAGYATGLIGKWHLGHTPDTNPLARGFDEFYGNMGGIFNYLPTAEEPEVRMQRGNRELYAAGEGIEIQRRWLRGLRTEPCPCYSTDAFNHETVSFVERHAGHPFMLFVCHHAPHTPLQTTDTYRARYPDGHFAAWGDRAADRRTYAGMVAALDDGIGMLMGTLERLNLTDNTLVVFFSDNGGSDAGLGCNAPLRGGKGTLWEGGIRIPWIASWPGRIPAGTVSAEPVCALDFWPTLRALAGGRDHPERRPDGVDLMPAFSGRYLPERPLVWRYITERAVRQGRWKYLQQDDGPPRLYDMTVDPREEHDVAGQHPETLRRMVDIFDDWELMMSPPQWGSPKKLEAFERNLRRRRGRT